MWNCGISVIFSKGHRSYIFILYYHKTKLVLLKYYMTIKYYVTSCVSFLVFENFNEEYSPGLKSTVLKQ
uniref:Uncharacterized protein n=1 Tax=Anguilla anguilla TaxID=7936 RepID=A0A0E9U3A7_ANGAN